MSFLSYFANKKTSSTLLEVKIMEINHLARNPRLIE